MFTNKKLSKEDLEFITTLSKEGVFKNEFTLSRLKDYENSMDYLVEAKANPEKYGRDASNEEWVEKFKKTVDEKCIDMVGQNSYNNRDAILPQLKKIEDILSKNIGGFTKFQNFTDDTRLRFQFNYDYNPERKNQGGFIGVGYLTLNELKEFCLQKEPKLVSGGSELVDEYIFDKDVGSDVELDVK